MFYVAILQPNTPITPNAESGSNTLFVGNLAYSVTRADVYVLFLIQYLFLPILAFLTYLTTNLMFGICAGKISSRIVEKLLMFVLLQIRRVILKDLVMLSLQQLKLRRR